jgi:hypothetical protein
LKKIRIFHHGKCFDGCCSAAIFQRFYRECFDDRAEFAATSLLYRAGALFNEDEFDGDENVIVDFKYSASPRLTWWFDHHVSAFLSPEDRAHFALNPHQRFYNPAAKSCAGLVARIAAEKFGFDASPVTELVKWADVIDAALFESPQAAVEMHTPAARIAYAIEAAADASFQEQIIPVLAYEPLEKILELPLVRLVLPSLLEHHQQSIATIRENSDCDEKTVFFDLVGQHVGAYNKFIPYYLYPDALYSVGLSNTPVSTKISVGSSPWAAGSGAILNLAELCEQYGGGGHAGVGAIAFPRDSANEARRTAAEIVAKLRAAAAVAEWMRQPHM